jgi:hypothetical protein
MYIGSIPDSLNLSKSEKEKKINEMVIQAKKEIEQQGD